MNYAVEKAKDGKPTGEFYFNPIAARLAGNEVVETHLGLKGDALNDYMDKYFDKTWRHFDTADNGEIEVARMGGFFRFFLLVLIFFGKNVCCFFAFFLFFIFFPFKKKN